MSGSKDCITSHSGSKVSGVASFWQRFVRDGEWFTWDRIGFSSAFSAALLVLVLAYLLFIPNAFTSSNGTFLMDYLSFWHAGQQALMGTPETVYNLNEYAELQKQVSASDTVFAFFYPPTFQLLQIPYALLSMKFAHLTFIGTTTFLLWWVLRMIIGNGLWAACLIMVPASLNNAFHGQNAALTASLYAIFLLGIERKKPVLAGIALGILTIKPQLGLLAPVALIASYNWRCFVSASITAVALAGFSVVVLGSGVWISFWQQAPIASEVMANGYVDWEKMISLYSSLRQFDISHFLSFGVQFAVLLAALLCVWVTWRSDTKMSIKAPVLIAGTLLSTPFALSYDFTLLIVPCAFIIREGMKTGFLPYEQVLLAVFFIFSGLTSIIALRLGMPIAPLVTFAILLLGMRRFMFHADTSSRTNPQHALSA